MAKVIHVEEIYGARFRSTIAAGDRNTEAESKYAVINAPDMVSASIALWDNIPKSIALDAANSLPLYSVEMDENNKTSDYVEAVVRYAPWNFSQPALGEALVSFSTGGGRVRVMHSKGTVTRVPAIGLPGTPDFGGGIEFSNGRFEGVDIVVPAGNMTIKRIYPAEFVTPLWVVTLNFLTGKVNANPFLIYDTGEALLVDCQGSPIVRDNRKCYEVTFTFHGSQNAGIAGTPPFQAPGFPPVPKYGHDYAWSFFKETSDKEGQATPKPVGLYVERVYEFADFSPLYIMEVT